MTRVKKVLKKFKKRTRPTYVYDAAFFLCSEGARALSSSAFGEGTGPIELDDVECVGDESRLLDCPASSCSNCDHTEDASVICTRKVFNFIFIFI